MTAPVPLAEQPTAEELEAAVIFLWPLYTDKNVSRMQFATGSIQCQRLAIAFRHYAEQRNRATLQQHERAMAEREIAFQQRDQMEAGSFHMLERIVKAETALRLVITQAGIPDPGDACRAIIKTARAALDDAASAAVTTEEER